MMTVVNRTTVVAGTRNTAATMANARKGATAPAAPFAMRVNGIPAKTDGAANMVAVAVAVPVPVNTVPVAVNMVARTVDGQAQAVKIMVAAKIVDGQALTANRRESLVVVAGQIPVADPTAATVVAAAGQVRIANLRAAMVAAKAVVVRQAGVANPMAAPMAAAAKTTTPADGTEIEGTTKAADTAAALRLASTLSGVSAKPRVAILETTTIRTTPHPGTCTATQVDARSTTTAAVMVAARNGAMTTSQTDLAPAENAAGGIVLLTQSLRGLVMKRRSGGGAWTSSVSRIAAEVRKDIAVQTIALKKTSTIGSARVILMLPMLKYRSRTVKSRLPELSTTVRINDALKILLSLRQA